MYSNKLNQDCLVIKLDNKRLRQRLRLLNNDHLVINRSVDHP